MKLITEKKVHPIILGLLVYLTFCLSHFYFARGDWAYALSVLSQKLQGAAVSNPIFAFLYGGIFSWVIYEVIVNFTYASLKMRLGKCADDLKYSINYFFIVANLLNAAFTLLYIISPIISVYGGIFSEFIITSICMVFYFMYIFKHCVEKNRQGMTLITIGGTYIIVFAVFAIFAIFGVL